MKSAVGYISLLCLLLISCSKDIDDQSVNVLEIMEVPPGFPEVIHPQGNEYTAARWKLGKKLFYDPILSRDGRVSCASCHDPSLAFSDKVAKSLGSEGLVGTRNSPSLANVAFHPYYTREGGLPTLEMQVLVPIQEHNEFDNNIVLIADTLAQIEEYVRMSDEAYGLEPNAFVITRALAQFERSIISGQSAYDYEYHYGMEGSMSASAIRGKALFESDRTSCVSCHGGFNFTEYAFQNNGLYNEYEDVGRARFTSEESDIGVFKVPTLRNVQLTGPYMHDGSLSTLMDVIDHYNSGGQNHPNKSPLIRPLDLTAAEKEDLLSFLHSLTDYNLTSNPNLAED